MRFIPVDLPGYPRHWIDADTRRVASNEQKLDAADLDYEVELKVNKPLTIDRSMPLMAFIPVDLLDRR